MITSNRGSILVIGYGNSLRSDDGAGCRVAEVVASWQLPYVRSLTVHQLAPELAEPLAEADLAIFIDAYIQPNKTKRKPTIQVQRISSKECQPINTALEIGHLADPRSLLCLAQQVYGKAPAAYSLLLPGVEWEFGEQVSALTRKSIDQAVDFLRTLCTRLVSSNPR
ncbi:hydrogenase maturation protease [Tumidithrix elongata RA019]|uniref:Hydrogenase maturation protease n=1 Tax=Tumidithrix elongata BACA0141 TaxID=2716417 RepID=A0AAW9PS75_9CYAN|nr:hydrogenase maturation protease [Tumidithrix elongata RA019]